MAKLEDATAPERLVTLCAAAMVEATSPEGAPALPMHDGNAAWWLLKGRAREFLRKRPDLWKGLG